MTSARLLSWGRYPPFPQAATRVYWRDDLPAMLADMQARAATTIGYGCGRSYGDSCLAASDHVLDTRRLDRCLAADWSAGVIRAEAGVTLAHILELAIPRGWFLPVAPGTKHVTIGGAIANDVHGKNHHRSGTFGRHVRAFSLARSDRGRLVCAPDAEAEMFAATIGGLGLTGVIEWAELQLTPIRSSRIARVTERFGDLEEFFALSDERGRQHAFTASWIDCAASGAAMGRGVHFAGDFAGDGELEVSQSGRLAAPFTPPFSAVNALSLRLFNEAYWHLSPRSQRADVVSYDPFFFPLDGIRDWNRIYGPKGFQQYQAVLPEAAARAGIAEILAAIAKSGSGSFLAVLKQCGGAASPGLLSFPMAGTSLALDFPQSDALNPTLFARLDAIVREANGRLYPAKDAHMSGADFRKAYPAWEAVEALRDPVLLSRFWKRVTQ